jgi:hypothetical protein
MKARMPNTRLQMARGSVLAGAGPACGGTVAYVM